MPYNQTNRVEKELEKEIKLVFFILCYSDKVAWADKVWAWFWVLTFSWLDGILERDKNICEVFCELEHETEDKKDDDTFIDINKETFYCKNNFILFSLIPAKQQCHHDFR